MLAYRSMFQAFLALVVLWSAALTVWGRDVVVRECTRRTHTCQCGSSGRTVQVELERRLTFDGFDTACEDRYTFGQRKGLCKKRCQRDCRRNCRKGGSCVNFKCVCKTGFTGVDCSQRQAMKREESRCPVVTKPWRGDVRVKGDNVTYSCNKGFKLMGRRQVLCRDNGTWSHDPPTCEPICKPPTEGKKMVFKNYSRHRHGHGTLKGVSGVYATLAVSCKKGYQLVGARTLECYSNGSWRAPFPFCEKRVECSEPPQVPHGSQESIVGTFHEDDSVIYECDDDYYLKGTDTLVCQHTGVWSPEPPQCVREDSVLHCPNLTNPANGRITVGWGANTLHAVPGVRVVYECDSGYLLSTDHTDRFCGDNGNWSGVEPQCVKVTTCTDPGTPANAQRCFGEHCLQSSGMTSPCAYTVTVNNNTLSLPPGQYPVGIRVKYIAGGYCKLNAPWNRDCKEKDGEGEWTDSLPKCEAVCGVAKRNNFIAGGSETSVELWPWHALLLKKRWEQYVPSCGGSLLGDRWVVTAAHCVTHNQSDKPLDKEALQVQLGKTHLSDSTHNGKVCSRQVSKIAVHPYYVPSSNNNDIALLKLVEPVQLSEEVRPVCFSGPSRRVPHDSYYLTGFGPTGTNGTQPDTFSDVLRMANVSVYTNNTECENLPSGPDHLTDNMFCAWSKEKMAPCKGDSGSPLVQRATNGRWYLKGIVSWGKRQTCRQTQDFAVFTKVENYKMWIEVVTGLRTLTNRSN